MIARRKPTRRDLLIVLQQMHALIDTAHSCHGNDWNPNGFEFGQRALEQARALGHAVRSFDPPLDGEVSKNGWGRA